MIYLKNKPRYIIPTDKEEYKLTHLNKYYFHKKVMSDIAGYKKAYRAKLWK